MTEVRDTRSKRAWRWLGGGGLALLGVGVGVGLVLRGRRSAAKGETSRRAGRDGARDRWARPGMSVTFRGELMPGRDRQERTFRVVELLPSGRVLLEGVAGEHTENEFEHAR